MAVNANLNEGGRNSSSKIKKQFLYFIIALVMIFGFGLSHEQLLHHLQNLSAHQPTVPQTAQQSLRIFDINDPASVSHSKDFVVWLYPFPPETRGDSAAAVAAQETLICPYTNACPPKQYAQRVKLQSINLRTLTDRTKFENYIRDHAWHKIRHFRDFSSHLQVITLLTLLIKRPGSCVRTLGSTHQLCDTRNYTEYNPYIDYGGNRSQFPIVGSTLQSAFPTWLLQDEQGASLVPDMTAERFAIYANGNPLVKTNKPLGNYNSGEDVQFIASAHWIPFISEFVEKATVLHNFTGFLVGNALTDRFVPPPHFKKNILEKYSLLSVFTPPSLLDAPKTLQFYKRYSEEIEPFGSRSTFTHELLLERNVSSYFSACLTTTINLQGGTLVNPNNYAPYFNAHEVSAHPTGANKQEAPKHNGVFMIDAGKFDKAMPKDIRMSAHFLDPIALVVPWNVRKNAKYLMANIPHLYPLKDEARNTRNAFSYAYRLLSQYAHEAKVIVTSRIHVGLPAMALGIPVIFIKGEGGALAGGHFRTGRVSGLIEMFHLIDLGKGDTWTFGGNDTSSLLVPPNPGNHKADRYRASFWNRLKRTSHFHQDTAKMFGMIPYERLGLANLKRIDLYDVFHFIIEPEDLESWQIKRAVELVYYFHPNARVYLHISDDGLLSPKSSTVVETFVESGYELVHKPFTDNVAAGSVESAYMLLIQYGGVFLSKSTFIRAEIAKSIDAGVMMIRKDVAMMVLGSRSPLEELSTILNNMPSWAIHVLSSEHTERCLRVLDPEWNVTKIDTTLAVKLDLQTLVNLKSVKLHSECYNLLEAKCIYCDEVHVDF